MAVYDTYGDPGWLVFGGTSESAQVVAGVYALVGAPAATAYGSYPYTHPNQFYDITSGSNGSCGTYLCNAGAGYDGPTGIGTPDGAKPSGPTITTGSSSNVGTTSATVPGTVNPNGQATTYHFDYGTSTSYGSQAPVPPDPSAGSGMTPQTVSATLTGLSQSTLYHYRIEATNASGTSYGADQTFRTTGLNISPSSVSGGSKVTVSWNGVPNPTTQDAIGVYHPGDPEASYMTWFWDSSCTQTIGSTALASGSCTFTVPNQVQIGTYELRLFSDNTSNNTYTLVFTSNSVSVT